MFPIKNLVNIHTENTQSPTNVNIQKSQRIQKSLGISLIVFGLFLMIAGIVSAALTATPLLALLAVAPLLSFIPAGVLLIKTARLKKQVIPQTPEKDTAKTSPKEKASREKQWSRSTASTKTTEIPKDMQSTTPEEIPGGAGGDIPEFTLNEVSKIFQQHFIPLQDQSTDTQKRFSAEGLTLICNKGSIEQPSIKLPTKIGEKGAMVCNAANPRIEGGGAGTNAALSSSVTPESWKLSGPKSKTRLNVGEVSTGFWVSSDRYEKKYGTQPENTWTFLGQMLGPRGEDFQNDASRAYSVVKAAYQEALAKATYQLEISFIQLPLISSGIYAPSSSPQREAWLLMVERAFIEAVIEIGIERKNRGRQSLVVCLVDYSQIPLHNLM